VLKTNSTQTSSTTPGAADIGTAQHGRIGAGAVILAFGANVAGRIGPPATTIKWSVDELARRRIKMTAWSGFDRSMPMGPQDQPMFFNAVGSFSTPLSPPALLIVLKELERRAGRGGGLRWGPRPLDIDIVDYKRVQHQSPGWRTAGAPVRPLIIPHAGLAQRAFVLGPLARICPRWRHPVSGRGLRELSATLRAGRPPRPVKQKICKNLASKPQSRYALALRRII